MFGRFDVVPYAPILGVLVIAIVLGVVIRSVVALPASFEPKSRYSARNVLQAAIIRTGLGTPPRSRDESAMRLWPERKAEREVVGLRVSGDIKRCSESDVDDRMSRERLLKIDRTCSLRVTVCCRRAKRYFAKDDRRLRDLTPQRQARSKSRRFVMLVFSIARNTDRSVERRLAIECEACGNIAVVTRMRRCRDVAIDRRRRFRAYRVSQRRCFRQKPFRSDTELTSWIETGTRIAGFGVLRWCVEHDFKSTRHSDTKSRQRISGERRTPDFGSILIVSGFDQDCGFSDDA